MVLTSAEMVADTIPPPTLPAPPTIKVCGCGRSYTAPEWRQLDFNCVQPDFDGGVLELRDCECGSTIAIEAPPTPEDVRRMVARTLERMRTVGIEP